MGKINLRPYQKETIDRTLSQLQNTRFALAVLAVGAGKSWIMVEVAKRYKRVVVLQPCLELVKQNHEKLANSGLNTTMIDSAHKGDWNADYIYTTPQTLCKNLHKCKEPDLVIIDECFTGDTLIATPDGYKKIKDIRVGDRVYNACGIGVVEAITTKQTEETIKMELSNGESIEGTGNHPIFTQQGWTRLDDLEVRQTLFGLQDMSYLWDDVSADSASYREYVRKESLLQCIVRECKNQTCWSKQERKEMSVWWERESNAFAGKIVGTNAERGRLGTGGCDTDEVSSVCPSLPNVLQGRYSRRKEEDCNRGGRRLSSKPRTKNARPEEEGTVGTVRVESISHNKQTSPRTVYNLQVSGHPSYFAGGVLVHNCNVFYEGSMFNTIFNTWKNCKVFGLTATPHYYRRRSLYKGGWVYSETTTVSIEEVFGRAVIELDRKKLKSMGYGPDIEIKRVQIPVCKTEHIDNPVVYHKILDSHIMGVNNLLKTLKNGIVFCDSRRHAEWLSNTFNIPTIFGDTPKKRRMDLIERFNQGRIPFLLTVGCLVRGYDRQDLENIILLTNFNNASEFEQVLGRLNRGTCSKTCWYNGRINQKTPVEGEVELVKIRRIGG